MADEPIGDPKVQISVDSKEAIRRFLETGKASKDLGKAIQDMASKFETAYTGKVSKVERGYRSFEKTINSLAREISGQNATANLIQMDLAVAKLGGTSKLTEVQLGNLRARVAALVAAGGKAPKGLEGITVSTSRLADAVKAETVQNVAALTGRLGPFGQVLTAIGPAGFAAAGGLALAGVEVKLFSSAASDSMAWGAKIMDATAATHMAVEEVQRLEYATKVSGTQFEVATDAVGKFQNVLVNAPEKLERIGLNVAALREMSSTDALATTARAIEGISDEETRNAVATEIFGKSWKDLAPFLTSGIAAMKDANVMTEDQVRALADAQTAANQVSAEWDNLWHKFGLAVVQGTDAEDALKALASGIKTVGEFSKEWGPPIWWILSRLATMPALGGLLVWKDLDLGGAVTSAAKSFVGAGSGPAPAAAKPVDYRDRKGSPWMQTPTKVGADPADTKALGAAQKALADARAQSLPALEREIAGIRESEKAKIAEATASIKDATIKKAVVELYHAEANALVHAAQASNQLELAKDLEADARARAAQAIQAEEAFHNLTAAAQEKLTQVTAASLGPLGEKIQKLEDEANQDVVNIANAYTKAAAQGAATEADLAERDAAIEAANAARDQSEQNLVNTEVKKRDAEITKIEEEAQAALAAAMAKGKDTLELQIGKIDAAVHARQAAVEEIINEIEAQRAAILASNMDAAAKDEQIKKLDALIGRLRGVQEAQGNAGNAEKDRARWESLGKTFGVVADLAGTFGDALTRLGVDGDAALSKIAQGVGAAAGGMSDLAKGISSGNMVQAIQGGINTALGLVDLGKGLADAFGESDMERIGKRSAEYFGISFSEELAKRIEKDAKRMGVDDAIIANLGDVFKEAGGVAKMGLEKATEWTHNLFSAVERGSITVEEAGEQFEEVFGDLAANAISKTTGIASKGFKDLIALAKRFGIESQAMKDFLGGQASGGIENLQSFFAGGFDKDGKISATLIHSKQSAEAFGAALAGLFAEAKANGKTTAEALKEIGPVVEMARKQFAAAGFDGGAAFAFLDAQIALVNDEVTGPLISGIGSIAAAMVNLDNLGLMNADMFAGMASEVANNYIELENLGKAGPVALQTIAPDLQKIWELQQRYGYAVDDSTQKLIDQGIEAGVIGEEHMSADERMILGIEGVTEAIYEMIEAMTGVPHEIKTKITTEHQDTYAGGGGGGNTTGPGDRPPNYPADKPWPPEGFSGGSGGVMDFGAGTLAMLHGREAVLTEDQLAVLANVPLTSTSMDSVSPLDAAVSRMTASGGSVAGMASANAIENVVINGANLKDDELVQRLRAELRSNRYGLLTDIQKALDGRL